MQDARPAGLYCPDETDEAALRVCSQVAEPLYRFDLPEPTLSPALAQGCRPDKRQMTWTCTLRTDVQFHDGAALDANDVVLSYAVQWDAANPLHRGRTGAFQAFATGSAGSSTRRPRESVSLGSVGAVGGSAGAAAPADARAGSGRRRFRLRGRR